MYIDSMSLIVMSPSDVRIEKHCKVDVQRRGHERQYIRNFYIFLHFNHVRKILKDMYNSLVRCCESASPNFFSAFTTGFVATSLFLSVFSFFSQPPQSSSFPMNAIAMQTASPGKYDISQKQASGGRIFGNKVPMLQKMQGGRFDFFPRRVSCNPFSILLLMSSSSHAVTLRLCQCVKQPKKPCK